jgi:AAA15 family ATPase/GTPase
MNDCAILEPDEIRVDAAVEIIHDEPRTMIHSLHIENFRCFPKLDLQDLGKFNIIVGNNGAGKTALLESIFLPGATHDMVFKLRSFRGLVTAPLTPVKETYESAWKDLFFKFSQTTPIKILLNGSEANSRKLSIYYSPEANMPLLIGFQPKPNENAPNNPKPASTSFVPLTFETDAYGKKYFNNAIFDQNGILIRTGEIPPTATIAFIPSTTQFQIVQQFSQIDVKNQKGKLVATLKEVFPAIDDISIQYTGGMPEIYCTIAALPEKIPVGLVSNGIHKLLTILLGIATQENGAVLVDEIENGIYFGSLGNAWRAILNFCKAYNVQLFASTHSLENLKSLIPFLSEDKNDFRLIRLSELQGGSHIAQISKGGDFLAALETETEVR